MAQDNHAPASRTARQARIRELVRCGRVASQSDLASILAAEGLTVSQGTLSRDLVEIGAAVSYTHLTLPTICSV